MLHSTREKQVLWCVIALVVAYTVIASIVLAQRRVLCSSPTDRTCPIECQRDLSHLPILIQRAPIEGHTGGMWLRYSNTSTIILNSNLPMWMQKEAEHHERCHEYLHITKGNHRFHP